MIITSLPTNIHLVCVIETEIVYLIVDANQTILIITLLENLCLEITNTIFNPELQSGRSHS